MSPSNDIIRGIVVNEQKVNCHMLTHQGDNEGYSSLWFGLLANKPSYVACDVVDELIREFHVHPTVGKKYYRETTFIYHVSLNPVSMYACSDDNWIVV